ncbi:hypothetical protein FB45DRAFT_874718 [Roridomyces roridus]|uniref:Uncharacterized protein n=1 Tax=Roridomyces roridus TaxID=1738132 RepID=A0AAD7FE22_9AGAR|nr:hypothetical protein FB45DRAFT_874718 [Roridomyces roridus]
MQPCKERGAKESQKSSSYGGRCIGVGRPPKELSRQLSCICDNTYPWFNHRMRAKPEKCDLDRNPNERSQAGRIGLLVGDPKYLRVAVHFAWVVGHSASSKLSGKSPQYLMNARIGFRVTGMMASHGGLLEHFPLRYSSKHFEKPLKREFIDELTHASVTESGFTCRACHVVRVRGQRSNINVTVLRSMLGSQTTFLVPSAVIALATMEPSEKEKQSMICADLGVPRHNTNVRKCGRPKRDIVTGAPSPMEIGDYTRGSGK